MKSSLSLRSASALLLFCLCSLALIACGGDDNPDDRKLSELDDQQAVEACNEMRAEVGQSAAVGLLRYTCVTASTIGGSCNANIFENCISVAIPGCTAYPAGSPERSCEATVAEARACGVAFQSQYSAYSNVSCSMPASSMPKKQSELSACATLCSKCPGMCT